MKSIESLHSKIDVVIKHLNIPLDAEGNPLPPATELPAATETIEVNPQSNVTEANPSEQKNSPGMFKIFYFEMNKMNCFLFCFFQYTLHHFLFIPPHTQLHPFHSLRGQS